MPGERTPPRLGHWLLTLSRLGPRRAEVEADLLELFRSREVSDGPRIARWKYLADVLSLAGVLPQAKYVVYFSIDTEWWDSVDIAEAMHPQTLLAYGMNGHDLSVGHGAPLRLRVPRQLGYKNIKYLSRITVTYNLKTFGKGLGSGAPEFGYSWYAGI